MKVLLLALPAPKAMRPLIPLGLLYIADKLAQHRIEYDLIDLNYTSDAEALLIRRLKRDKPDMVGISVRNIAETTCMNVLYVELTRIVSIVRQYAKVILGGAGFTIFPHELMRLTQADFGIAGAGETAIISLIANLDVLEPGSIVSEAEGDFINSDISLAIGAYWQEYGKYFVLGNAPIPVQTIRGCNLTCRYCTYPSLSGQQVEKRAVGAVVCEISNTQVLTKHKHFYFVDSVFNLDLGYTKALLRAIIDARLDIQWGCGLNPQNYDEELLALLRRAGCTYCEIGVDSFSATQLKRMGKTFSAAHAVDLISRLEVIGIPCSASLILGGPGETETTVLESVHTASSLGIPINCFLGERIYPHTPLEQLVNEDKKRELFIAGGDAVYVSRETITSLRILQRDKSPEKWTFSGDLPMENEI